MYDVTTQFFPQFLTFQMAEERVPREDVATLRTKYDTGRDLFTLEALAAPNLVPRSHSVTENVRSGKVRQYTIFHWALKKGCGNAIYAPIGLFRGARNEGLVFASSCAVLHKYQLRGRKFCFSDAGKALQ